MAESIGVGVHPVEAIKQFVKLSANTAGIIRIYVDAIRQHISGANPLLIESIDSHMKAATVASIDIDQTPSLNDLFIITKKLSIIRTAILELDDMLASITPNNLGNRASSGAAFSSVFLENINDAYADVMIAIDKYKTIDIATLIRPLVVPLTDDTLVEARKIYDKYFMDDEGILVVDAYIELLQNSLNQPGQSGLGRRIVADIETLKTNVLVAKSPPIDPIVKVRQANALQWLIQKYNLSPDAPSRPLSAIWKELQIHGDNDFNKIAKMLSNTSQKIGIIVINKQGDANTVINNIWTILDKDYIASNKLPTDNKSGINAQWMERTRTIAVEGASDQLGTPRSKNADSEVVQFYDSEHSKDELINFYYVFETADGINYRILVPWRTGSSLQARKFFPARWISGIKSAKTSPSPRLSAYNSILNEAITAAIQEPLISLDMLSRDDIRQEMSRWNSVRGSIKNDILDTISDPAKFIKAIKSEDDALYQQILALIAQRISIDGLNLNELTTWQRELVLTYYKDYDALQRGLKQYTTELYFKEYEGILRDSAGDQMRMRRIVGELIDDVLEKFISRKSNIYLALEKKIELIKTSTARQEEISDDVHSKQ